MTLTDYDSAPPNAGGEHDAESAEVERRSARQRRDLLLIDRGEIDQLLAEYVDVIRAIAKTRGLREGEVLEVISIVLERMDREIRKGRDFSRTSFYGSVRQKIHWEAGGRRAARDGKPWEQLTDPDDMAEMGWVVSEDRYPSDEISDNDELQEALEGLTDLERDVIHLTVIEGLSVSEAATALGIAANAVSARKFRALKKMRERLEAGGA